MGGTQLESCAQQTCICGQFLAKRQNCFHSHFLNGSDLQLCRSNNGKDTTKLERDNERVKQKKADCFSCMVEFSRHFWKTKSSFVIPEARQRLGFLSRQRCRLVRSGSHETFVILLRNATPRRIRVAYAEKSRWT